MLRFVWRKEGRRIEEQHRGLTVREQQAGEGMVGVAQSGTQDSDPFELGPIIAAVSRESRRRKRRITEVEGEVEVTGWDDRSIRHK